MSLRHFVWITSNMAFSRSCSPKWAKAGFQVMLEDFEIYKKASVFCSSAFSLLYQTNVFYLAVHLFSNRLQKTSSLVWTTVTPSAITSCVTFCSYHILESSAIYYWTEAQLHGIFLLNSQLNATCLVGYPSSKLYPWNNRQLSVGFTKKYNRFWATKASEKKERKM